VRAILHVDMDAFYAAVEQRDDPAIRGKPVVVGARSARGVVAAASYESRKFGIRSAMSMMDALRRCPDAIVVPPRFAVYAEVSREVFAIFHRFTPLVEGLSLDEAFLDVTASRTLYGSGTAIAERIRRAIVETTSLTASAGVATSKFVAKIASDVNKPDGLTVVEGGTEAAFLAPLPIERMWGVGPKAAERLHSEGLPTIGDLARAPRGTLERALGRWGLVVSELARGEDTREVVPGEASKSVGAEETFERDLRETDALERELLAQCARVAARLVDAGLFGSVVTVKVKYGDHRLCTRQAKLPEPAADTDALFAIARVLLAKVPDVVRGVRLTGVAVSDLTTHAPLPGLFDLPSRGRGDRLERATQSLRERFGEGAITRARLLDRAPAPLRGPPPKTRREPTTEE
jgi:DNA polymerase-4